MGRKCSHCGNIGHNSRTCNISKLGTTTTIGSVNSGVRLFGVQLDMLSTSSLIPMKKSFSLDCLSSTTPPSSSSPSSSLSSPRVRSINENCEKITSIGYLSDGLLGRAPERKKGVPWTEEEHRTFLIGLEKLGKGDWRGISRNFVTTRTPTQVASHAQKYFLRQASLNKKNKRRSSLFDMNAGLETVPTQSSKREAYIDLNLFGEGERIHEEMIQNGDLNDISMTSSHENLIWACESLNSQLSLTTTQNQSRMTSYTQTNVAPELELKLSGPISVT